MAETGAKVKSAAVGAGGQQPQQQRRRQQQGVRKQEPQQPQQQQRQQKLNPPPALPDASASTRAAELEPFAAAGPPVPLQQRRRLPAQPLVPTALPPPPPPVLLVPADDDTPQPERPETQSAPAPSKQQKQHSSKKTRHSQLGDAPAKLAEVKLAGVGTGTGSRSAILLDVHSECGGQGVQQLLGAGWKSNDISLHAALDEALASVLASSGDPRSWQWPFTNLLVVALKSLRTPEAARRAPLVVAWLANKSNFERLVLAHKGLVFSLRGLVDLVAPQLLSNSSGSSSSSSWPSSASAAAAAAPSSSSVAAAAPAAAAPQASSSSSAVSASPGAGAAGSAATTGSAAAAAAAAATGAAAAGVAAAPPPIPPEVLQLMGNLLNEAAGQRDFKVSLLVVKAALLRCPEESAVPWDRIHDVIAWAAKDKIDSTCLAVRPSWLACWAWWHVLVRWGCARCVCCVCCVCACVHAAVPVWWRVTCSSPPLNVARTHARTH
jgi:hypothetical protein